MSNSVPELTHKKYMGYCPRCGEFDVDKGDPCISFMAIMQEEPLRLQMVEDRLLGGDPSEIAQV